MLLIVTIKLGQFIEEELDTVLKRIKNRIATGKYTHPKPSAE